MLTSQKAPHLNNRNKLFILNIYLWYKVSNFIKNQYGHLNVYYD